MALSAAGREVNPPQRQPVRRLPEYLKLLLPSQLPLFCVCFFFFYVAPPGGTSAAKRATATGDASGEGGAEGVRQNCGSFVMRKFCKTQTEIEQICLSCCCCCRCSCCCLEICWIYICVNVCACSYVCWPSVKE